MSNNLPIPRRGWQPTRPLALTSLMALLLSAPLGLKGVGDTLAAGAEPATKKRKKPEGIEVHFRDGKKAKVIVLDKKVQMKTKYGELVIPVADIHRIEFATRIDKAIAKQIQEAITNLRSAEFGVRNKAKRILLGLKEHAYPALLEASRDKDREVARVAKEVLSNIRATVPARLLKVRASDVLYTKDCKITGLLITETWQVKASAKPASRLEIKNLFSMRSLAVPSPEPVNVLPDPRNLTAYARQIGKTFAFRVTGKRTGSLWGTDTYTSDSTLGMAAVHAGVLKVGQTGVVKVTIVVPPPRFAGTTRHGITSSSYGVWGGAYRVSKVSE